MDRAWVDEHKNNARKRFDNEKQRIRTEIENNGEFEPYKEKEFLDRIDSILYDDEYWRTIHKLNELEMDLRFGHVYTHHGNIKRHKEWFDKNLMYDKLKSCLTDYERYLDNEPMEFDGDIIITDPCYIVKDMDYSDQPTWGQFHPYKSIYEYPDYNKETMSSEMYNVNEDAFNKSYEKWVNEHKDDWDICDCGSNMEALGINNYMTRDTLYGDWSCTTFNTDTGERIGEFCADAGLISVFNLSEVLAYNPEFNYHINRKWTTTLIKDFKGTVQFVVKYISDVYDYSVEVVGHGINKVTGEPINFVGKQTGF